MKSDYGQYYQEFYWNFSDIGNPNLVEIRKDLQPYGSYMAPGVEMHCLFGNSDDGIVDRFVNRLI